MITIIIMLCLSGVIGAILYKMIPSFKDEDEIPKYGWKTQLINLWTDWVNMNRVPQYVTVMVLVSMGSWFWHRSIALSIVIAIFFALIFISLCILSKVRSNSDWEIVTGFHNWSADNLNLDTFLSLSAARKYFMYTAGICTLLMGLYHSLLPLASLFIVGTILLILGVKGHVRGFAYWWESVEIFSLRRLREMIMTAILISALILILKMIFMLFTQYGIVSELLRLGATAYGMIFILFFASAVGLIALMLVGIIVLQLLTGTKIFFCDEPYEE